MALWPCSQLWVLSAAPQAARLPGSWRPAASKPLAWAEHFLTSFPRNALPPPPTGVKGSDADILGISPGSDPEFQLYLQSPFCM